MNPTIRAATSADLPAILGLYDELEGPGFEPDPVRAESVFERIRRYPAYTVYVLCQESRVLGTFALLIMDNLAHGGAPSGIVEDVVVRADHQGLGLGKMMMHFAMDVCRQAGCYKLMLSSNQKRVTAHVFYESLGFDRHGFSFVVPLRSVSDDPAPSPFTGSHR